MSSRDNILATVKQHQPAATTLPQLINYQQPYQNVVEQFTTMLRFIGGEAYVVNDFNEIKGILQEKFMVKRILSTCSELAGVAEMMEVVDEPHQLADVDLFITTSDLAVAENGAVWVNDNQLPARALPFIAQQLAVIIRKENIVQSMHHAYDVIGETDYGYAVFIAGPSKTADIAQSLVLGAHGPKGMTVFVI